TEDNHPVPLHLLKTAEQSVYAARDKVTELAQQVTDNNATTEQNTRLAIQANEQAQQAKTEASQSATQAVEVNKQTQQAKTEVQTAKEIAVSSMQAAEQSKNQAIQAENLAKKWASNPQNQIVQEGKYSAYHYALEAEKHAEKVKATAEGRKDWQFIDNVPISKDVNDNSETKLASAFSVKTAYDKAVEAEKIANGKSNFKIEQGKDNADNYKTDGHYYFAQGQNLPDNSNNEAWHIEVISGGNPNAVRQIARKANDTKVKTRFFNGSDWTAWKSVGGDGVPLGAIVAFPKEVKNPTGFLKCDGATFTQSLYPELYRVLGNQNKLPDLTRSDVGMTAYFATDNIPDGWIAFDEIKEKVNEDTYPELYKYLIEKYTSIDNVPKAEDRFLRNAHGELKVGMTQLGSLIGADSTDGNGAFSPYVKAIKNTYQETV
ncbi:tail fiber protein, partial [Histophilus somni]